MKPGDIITIKLVEVEADFLIVSLEGKLMRIHNHTGEKWNVGDRVTLVVKKIKPTELVLSSSRSGLNIWC